MSVLQIICIVLFVVITISANAAYFMMHRKMHFYDIPMGITLVLYLCNGVVFASILLGAWGIFG